MLEKNIKIFSFVPKESNKYCLKWLSVDPLFTNNDKVGPALIVFSYKNLIYSNANLIDL